MAEFAHQYGEWALVAGASEGLGAAFARELASRNLNVIVLARQGELLEQLREEIQNDFDVQVRCITQDLAADDLVSRLSDQTADVDVGLVIYNAAYVPVGSFASLDLDALKRAVDVNVQGPLTVVNSFLPAMRQRKRGAIVLMSSVSGMQGCAEISVYAATKSFNTILGDGLWEELRHDGVDVVVCCAGAMPTPGYQRSFSKSAPGMMDERTVARQTLDALQRGPRFIPGVMNKVAVQFMLRLMPKRLAVKIMSRSVRQIA